MKLHYSATSPFVRKVLVSAIELGLDGEIEKVPAQVSPINRSAAVIADNPLGQVPTLDRSRRPGDPRQPRHLRIS